MSIQNEITNKIKETVLRIDKDAQVILFGSRARGDYRPDSDWDMLVIAGGKVDGKYKREITDHLYDVELEYLQAISTVFVEKQNWYSMAITSFYQNVIRDGKAL